MNNELLAKLKNNEQIMKMICSQPLRHVLIDLIERQKQFNDTKEKTKTNFGKSQRNDGLSPLESVALFESNEFQDFVKEVLVLLDQ